MAAELVHRRPSAGRDWTRALMVASLTGWLVIVLASMTVQIFIAFAEGSPDPSLTGQLFNQLIVFALFGIPTAFVASFVAGLPVILLAIRFNLSKWWQASLLGAGVGLGIALIPSLLSGIWDESMLRFGAPPMALAGAIAGVAAWCVLVLRKEPT